MYLKWLAHAHDATDCGKNEEQNFVTRIEGSFYFYTYMYIHAIPRRGEERVAEAIMSR